MHTRILILLDSRGSPQSWGENLEGEKPFHGVFWNEVKWEEELAWDPGDLTAVERGKGSGRQTARLWGIRQGGLGARVAGESSSCGSGRSLALRISQGCLGVLIQTRKTLPWLQAPSGY